MKQDRMRYANRLSSLDDISPEVLIVGGGINGIGVFRDLALQGVRVLLVERGDFCSGASAASSHMAHGGIRYLENGEFRLVREAVQERNRMLRNAPHLVRPLPTVIPIFRLFSGLLNAPLKFLDLLDRPAERGAVVIKLGLLLYDAYTRSQGSVPRHRFAGRRASLQQYPDLDRRVRFTATYYDGQILSPERYAVELLLDGEAEGPHARAFNYTRFVIMENGRVRLKDELTGETFRLAPRLVVNAAGPWIDQVNRRMGITDRAIGGTKGSHLVLRHPKLRAAIGDAEFFFENDDGRIVLILPFYDKVIVGTSDLPIDNPDAARCTPDEEQYFFSMIRRIFPEIRVGPADVVFRFSGVRPLQRMEAKSAGQIHRDHRIKRDEIGGVPVLSLVGGKWTSYRAFAEETTDAVLQELGRTRLHSTDDLPIGGGRAYPPSAEDRAVLLDDIVTRSALPPARVEQLFQRYGTLAADVAAHIAAGVDRPLDTLPGWTRREIDYLVQREKAVHLDDLLLRRTTLGWLGEITPERLAELAAVMEASLGWEGGRRLAEIRRTIALFQDRHGVDLAPARNGHPHRNGSTAKRSA